MNPLDALVACVGLAGLAAFLWSYFSPSERCLRLGHRHDPAPRRWVEWTLVYPFGPESGPRLADVPVTLHTCPRCGHQEERHGPYFLTRAG
jgi:hypothetical protein